MTPESTFQVILAELRSFCSKQGWKHSTHTAQVFSFLSPGVVHILRNQPCGQGFQMITQQDTRAKLRGRGVEHWLKSDNVTCERPLLQTVLL